MLAFTWHYVNQETLRLVYDDFKYVGMVIIACLLYMSFHMKSFFLALISLLNVIMSMPITLCIYTFIFKVTFFSSIHIAILIVVVGIGADDIFVFHDFWENTR